MSPPLHLVHLPISLEELALFAQDRNRGTIRRRRHDGREVEAGLDEGRALHHLLDETFGPGALRPFRLMVAPGKSKGSLYAYSGAAKEALQATAAETAPPEALRVLTLDRLAERAMPEVWACGRRLAFDIRIRPVVRIKAPLPDPRHPGASYAAGAELDAFFVEAQRKHLDARPQIVDGKALISGMRAADRSREAVYCDWLAARLYGAAKLDPVRTKLERFERSRVARQGHAPEGPDAVLHGELEVQDGEAFGRLLAKGIGRHKAYGYGMLMLRPARLRQEG